MDRQDWANMLLTVLFTLLSEYMRKHGSDQAQELISKLSANLADQSDSILGLIPKGEATDLFS